MTVNDDRMTVLFDFMADRPDGATMDEMSAELGCTYDQTAAVVHHLRRFLGTDEINLTCNRQGHREQWRYRLVGRLDDQREWQANRTKDAESRLITMYAMLESATRASDGRTLEGKRARIMHKQIGRMLEDLREL